MLHIGARLELARATYDEVRDQAVLAESLGYDSIWLRDHVSIAGTTGNENALECWTAMAALARDTQRIEIGSLVLCTPFRNPALLAKMAATLDIASGGRLIVGIGAGNIRAEFEEYGYTFPSPADRLAMVDETARILRLMWTEHRPSFEGKHYTIRQALNEPKPRRVPPLLIGATGPRALRIVAERADIWSAATSMSAFWDAREILHRHLDAIGRDPASLRQMPSVYVIVDRDETRARERHAAAIASERVSYVREFTIAGTPEMIVEGLRPLLDAGIRDFVLFTVERRNQAENMTVFAEEVAPLLRQLAGEIPAD